MSEQKCRKCGCTQDHACDGGCFWWQPDLCSKCATTEDLPALDTESERVLGNKVQLIMTGMQALELLSTIQLACRHPDFRGASRDFSEGLARDLQKGLSATPLLAALTEAGWDPQHDRPVESVRGRIITP